MQTGFLAVEIVKRKKIERNERDKLFVTGLICTCLVPSDNEPEVLSYRKFELL